MNYDNFDTQEQESLIELHKTDYNNYADLSHFVDEYYKAQALINECNNFYRSFLKSKLLPYSKIANSIYSQDKYKFYTYQLSDSVNGTVKFGEEYPISLEIDKANSSRSYKLADDSLYISIKGLSYLAAAGASFKVFQELFSDSDRKYDLSFSCLDMRVTPDKLILRSNPRIRVDFYGNLNIWKENGERDYEYKARIKYAYKTLGVKNEDELDVLIKPIRKKVDEIWESTYKKEIIRLFEKYDVLVSVVIDNKLMNDAKYCLYEYIGEHKASKEIANQYNDYFSDKTNNLTISLKDFIDSDKMNEVLSKYADHQCIGHWGYGPMELLAYIDSDKLNEYIKEQLSESTAVFRKILMTYEPKNKAQNLYIIDNHNEAQFFCSTKDLNNVHIELKGRELVCEYIAVDRFKKYAWPSNTPWTVVTDTTTIIFNVSDNSIKSFNHTSTTHEEQVKYRR